MRDNMRIPRTEFSPLRKALGYQIFSRSCVRVNVVIDWDWIEKHFWRTTFILVPKTVSPLLCPPEPRYIMESYKSLYCVLFPCFCEFPGRQYTYKNRQVRSRWTKLDGRLNAQVFAKQILHTCECSEHKKDSVSDSSSSVGRRTRRRFANRLWPSIYAVSPNAWFPTLFCRGSKGF